jgi:hypothetical protein
VIVSWAHRLIFVHVPKTGGSALAQALEAVAGPEDLLIGDSPAARARRPALRRRLRASPAAGRVWKHSRLAEIEGLVPRADFAGFRVVTIVRNPWERLASYYHWLRVQRFAHPHVALAVRLGFAGFVGHPGVAASFRAAPAAAYVRDGAGVEHCALWLRHERLAEDAGRLAAMLGVDLPPLAQVNVGPRPADWRAAYTPEAVAQVAEVCAADIARFGYRFEG